MVGAGSADRMYQSNLYTSRWPVDSERLARALEEQIHAEPVIVQRSSSVYLAEAAVETGPHASV